MKNYLSTFFLLLSLLFMATSESVMAKISNSIIGKDYAMMIYSPNNTKYYDITFLTENTLSYELVRNSDGDTDSGISAYILNEDGSFIIPDDETPIKGVMSKDGYIFAMIDTSNNDPELFLGVQKSHGKTNAAFIGEFISAIHYTNLDQNTMTMGSAYISINSAGDGTGQVESIHLSTGGSFGGSISYSLFDDGTFSDNDKDAVMGIVSPDSQVYAAVQIDSSDGNYTQIDLGIKKSSFQTNAILNGDYLMCSYFSSGNNQFENPSAEGHYFLLEFDGEGTGIATNMDTSDTEGNGTFSYNVYDDGTFIIPGPGGDDSDIYGIVSANGHYFALVDADTSKEPSIFIGIAKSDSTTNIDIERTGLLNDFVLYQNYPNPFNQQTTISYQLPKNSKIELIIYNITGQDVSTLVSKKQTPGNYTVNWDASGLSSGVYIYLLKSDNKLIASKKMILLK